MTSSKVVGTGINRSSTFKKSATNNSNKKANKRRRIIPIVQRPNKQKAVLVQRTIDYKNIVLLRKFITVEGKILPRRISGLTAKQQRNMGKAIKNARMVGLLPFIKKNQPSTV
uniref:Small ribosomal subunit protein bS18c n=1 Tax=Prasiolopsis wulf-kochii TaxID=3239232 RepID=A0A097KK28_9CHLO|nr:ribosomal protein S18 [Prasiolopsis sp. SAG 84.81]